MLTKQAKKKGETHKQQSARNGDCESTVYPPMLSFVRGELPGGKKSAAHDCELDGAALPDDAIL